VPHAGLKLSRHYPSRASVESIDCGIRAESRQEPSAGLKTPHARTRAREVASIDMEFEPSRGESRALA
jgi:hypothetical protein